MHSTSPLWMDYWRSSLERIDLHWEYIEICFHDRKEQAMFRVDVDFCQQPRSIGGVEHVIDSSIDF